MDCLNKHLIYYSGQTFCPQGEFMSYYITADNGVDFPRELLKNVENIAFEPLPVSFNGTEFDGKTNTITFEEFYKRVANKEYPKTSMVNIENATNFLENILKQGYDILHISLSSTLSGTHNSFEYAGKILQKKYPERKIFVLDSVCGGPGQSIVFYNAVKMRDNGVPIEKVYSAMAELKDKVCIGISIDDLFYLSKGGRITKEQAILGSIIKLKPILYFDTNGKLQHLCKVITKKKAMQRLAEIYLENKDFSEGKNELFISHSDAYDDAEYLAALIRSESPETKIYIDYLGTTTGAFAGIGTVTIAFVSKRKNLQ